MGSYNKKGRGVDAGKRRSNKAALALCLALALPLQGILPATASAAPPDDDGPEQQAPHKLIRGSGEESSKGMAVHSDGSYALLLSSDSTDLYMTGIRHTDDTELLLVKYNDDHVLEWIKPLGIAANDNRTVLKALPDGGYIVAGMGYNNATASDDGYIAKFDAAGEPVWRSSIGGTGSDGIKDVILSRDGLSYVVTGETKSNDGTFDGLNAHKANLHINSPSAFVAALQSSNGSLQWANVIDGRGVDVGEGIIELQDHYVAIGITSSTDNDFNNFNLHGTANNYDLYIAALDKTTGELSGTPQSYGHDGTEYFGAVLPTRDGGFILSGNTMSAPNQLADGNGGVFVAKFDANGIVQWAERIGDADSWTSSNLVQGTADYYALGVADSIYVIQADDSNETNVNPMPVPFVSYITSLVPIREELVFAGDVWDDHPLFGEVVSGMTDVLLLRMSGTLSAAEAVAEDAYNLDIQYSESDRMGWVTGNIQLPLEGMYGSTYTWTSNHPAVVIDPATGVAEVTRPAVTEADLQVTLTAVVEHSGVTKSRSLVITVKKESVWQPYLSGEALDSKERFKMSADGTVYLHDGASLLKQREDGTFVDLPALPLIPEETYYDIVNRFALDGNDLYIMRLYSPKSGNPDQYGFMKLDQNGDWAAVAPAVPDHLAPFDEEKWGTFEDYSYYDMAVDNGDIYVSMSASYRGGVRGSTGIGLLMKWDGTVWTNVTPGANTDGIAGYAVQDGKIYAFVSEEGSDHTRLIVTDGTQVIAQQEMDGVGKPNPNGDITAEVDADGALYVVDRYSGYSTGNYIWKGVINGSGTPVWSVMDDSYKFRSPRSLNVVGQNLYVMERTMEGQSILRRPTVITDAPGGNGGGNGGNGGSNSGPIIVPVEETTPVSLNGETKQVSVKTSTRQENGRNVTTVALDNGKLMQEVGGWKRGTVFTVPVAAKAGDSSEVDLNAALVKAMDAADTTLEVKTEQATYRIPAKQVFVDRLLKQFGDNVDPTEVKLSVRIGTPAAAEQQLAAEAAQKAGTSLIIPAISFEVTATYNGSSLAVDSFTQYVERRVPIPATIDPAKITTGVLVEADGTIRHVPTKVILENGVHYAEINSLTNSLYSVVWNPVQFTDMVNHWAEVAVNNMGSRMVVQGDGEGNYEPGRGMTRAEFAATIVRALGLKPSKQSAGFSDTAASDWYAAYVNTAAEYGLIRGYEDNTFAPSKRISRQEAIAMIARAAAVTELQGGEAADGAVLLASYADEAQVQQWARESIAFCLEAGLVQGQGMQQLAPNAEVTRAEVAVMVERLLKQSSLINE